VTETTTYTVEVHHEEDGTYWAEVRDLPGCFASGDTLDELREAIAEAISLVVRDDPTAGRVTRMGELRPTEDVGEMTVLVGAC
jgi:predicted RNase H-like HicB family nuclease